MGRPSKRNEREVETGRRDENYEKEIETGRRDKDRENYEKEIETRRRDKGELRNNETERRRIYDERERNYDDDYDDETPAPIRKDTTPEQFKSLNSLEICSWLVKHPDILDLANRMMSAGQSLLDNSKDIYQTQPSENKVIIIIMLS